MGKQKVEIKVPMVDDKKRSKVMQIIAKQSGIMSIAADRENSKVTVLGNENMDVMDMTMKLRKQMRRTYVAIDSVTAIDEKKEKEDKEKKEKEEKEKKEKEKKKEEAEKGFGPKIIHPPCHLYIQEVPSQTGHCCQM